MCFETGPLTEPGAAHGAGLAGLRALGICTQAFMCVQQTLPSLSSPDLLLCENMDSSGGGYVVSLPRLFIHGIFYSDPWLCFSGAIRALCVET